MINIKKLFKMEGKHKQKVLVHGKTKTFYREQMVGRKEGELVKMTNIVIEQNKTINAIHDIISSLENKKTENEKLLLSPIMRGSDAGPLISQAKGKINKINSLLKRLNSSLNKYNKEKYKGLRELDERRINWEMNLELDYDISELELISKKIYSSLKL